MNSAFGARGSGGDAGQPKVNPAELPIRDAIQLGLNRRALQVTPHLILLQRHFYEEELSSAIARWVAWWLRSRGRLQTAL